MSFTRTLRVVGGTVMAGALLFGNAPVASADQIRDSQWALDTFNADKVWKESTGKGIMVAVIDNGVRGSHPDLQGNILPGKNFSAGDPADQEKKNEHGTAMASIIAGHGHGPGNSQGVKGLAPDAEILPIKTHDVDGSDFTTGQFAKPLRYAVDQGAEVVNMSFGGLGELGEEEKQAIIYAVQHDVLLVAASGNSGSGNLEFPAAAPGVVAVGAVGTTQKIWENSNYGSHLLLSAPGQKITVAGVAEQYVGSKGTSDATAYVSAAAALLRAKFPNLTAGQIANRLTKTAVIPEGVNVDGTPDMHYGYGVIRPYEALTKDIPAGPKNGPLKAPEAAPISPPPNASASDSPGGWTEDTAAILGVVGFVATVLVISTIVIVIIVVRRNKRRNGPPPGGPGRPGRPGGYGGPGAPGFPPYQPNPYQQPTSSSVYPPGPHNQPPAQ